MEEDGKMEHIDPSILQTADSAWKRFEKSGTIEDYLSYRSAAESRRIIDNVNQNPGSCPKATEYR